MRSTDMYDVPSLEPEQTSPNPKPHVKQQLKLLIWVGTPAHLDNRRLH